jgi:hypothetical protein
MYTQQEQYLSKLGARLEFQTPSNMTALPGVKLEPTYSNRTHD